MLSRRSFFKLASAAAITPILPSLVVEPEIIANAEFGFTWGNVQSSSPTFSKLITSTLTKRAPEIRKQLVGNNSLLVRLNSNKAIKITRITPEEQTKRMIEKVGARRKKFDRDLRCDQYNTVQKIKKSGIKSAVYYDGYEPLEKKFGV